MKLTKDDFIKDENGTYHYNFSWLESQVDEILKNQEKAEKWDKSNQVVQYSGNTIRKYHNAVETVERLKKRIKSITCEALSENEEMNFTTEEYNGWMKRELQKILGER